MATREALHRAFMTLLTELLDGPPGETAFALNPGDRGLLASVARLSAAEASARPGGRSSVAAHVDHLRYGFELLNRWSRGEDPWSSTDYAASWRRQEVSEAEWRALQDALRSEASAWRPYVEQLQDAEEIEWAGILGSLVHLGYHFGAIRQLAPSTSGPRARD